MAAAKKVSKKHAKSRREGIMREGTAKDWRGKEATKVSKKHAESRREGIMRTGTAKDWRGEVATEVSKKHAKSRSEVVMRMGTAKDWRSCIQSSAKTSAKRVIKDSPVRGKFSRSEIRAAVQTVARRHGAT